MSLVLPFATSSRRIAVLGGGLSGLAAAYRLARLGHAVRLFEDGGRLGGCIQTEMVDGWLVEGGPISIRETSPIIPLVLKGIGITRDRVDAAPTARRRYVSRRGRAYSLPEDLSSAFLSGLLSPWGKLGILRDLTRRRRADAPDRSFAKLLREHGGREAADYVAQPLASALYGGDADRLSSRFGFPRFWDMDQLHGSFLRAHQEHTVACAKRYENPTPTIFSFRRGMQTLCHAYVLQLPSDVIVLNARVEGLVPGPKWHVIWRDGRSAPASAADDAGRHVEGFDAVVVALPAVALARLEFGARDVRPLAVLDEVEHAPIASLFLGYRRDQVAHPLDGYGLHVPKREGRSFLSATFVSSVFPGRAPEGCVALTLHVGGVLRPELAALPTADLLKAVAPDLQELLGVRGDPVFVRHRSWLRGIPQYNLGYERFLDAIFQCEKANPGLFIGGHVREGIAPSDGILSGERQAERAHAFCTG